MATEKITYSGGDRFRVYNKCKYSIGVRLLNGVELLIQPGSFQMMTMDDILFVDSSCASKKFFSQKMLEVIDQAGNAVSLEQLNMVEEEIDVHMSDEEIMTMLKKPPKQIEAWLETISEEDELHGIYEVAKSVDLTAAKLKVLSAKMPDKEWLDG